MTLFLLHVKNSARIPCFARYLAGLIIQKDGRGRGGWPGKVQKSRRGTINYRTSALSLEIPAELLATDILNLHRRPGKSFVRISLRESRERGSEPVGNSLRKHESREGYLIRFRPSRLLPNTFCKRSGYIDLQFPAEARQANVFRQ